MGCGSSKPAADSPDAAPGPAASPPVPVADTNKKLLALQATGGGSVLLRPPTETEGAVAPREVADGGAAHVHSRGGSYLIAFDKQDEHYTLGSDFEHPKPLPATRQVYIVQPGGKQVLRVSYG